MFPVRCKEFLFNYFPAWQMILKNGLLGIKQFIFNPTTFLSKLLLLVKLYIKLSTFRYSQIMTSYMLPLPWMNYIKSITWVYFLLAWDPWFYVLEILIYVTISIKIITLGLYYKNIYDTIDGASVKFSNKIYNDSQLWCHIYFQFRTLIMCLGK